MENTNDKKINKSHKTFYMNKSVLSKLDSLSKETCKKQVDILQELIIEKYEKSKQSNALNQAKQETRAGIEDLAFIATQMNNKIEDFKLELISEMRNLHNENKGLKAEVENKVMEVKEQERKKITYAQEKKDLKELLDELVYRINQHNNQSGIMNKKIDISDLVD